MFVNDQRGYSQIVTNMAQQIPLEENKNLYLGHYVDVIKYDQPGEYPIEVVAHVNKNEDEEGSEFKDEDKTNIKVFKAKWVIVTFSIGVLQSEFVDFVPALPNWKLETIYNFKMTRYIKIFVKFNKNVKKFWDDNHYIMYVDPYVRGKYQMWQNLEARGKYFPEGNI